MTRGLHASWDGKLNNYVGNIFDTQQDLHEFQVYSVERNDTHIVWKLNDQTQLEFDTRQEWKDGHNPFAPNNYFYITINLGVGGRVTQDGAYFFKGSQDVREEAKRWKCSSFLIDYVKVIGRNERDDPTFVRAQDKKASDICKGIMNRLRAELNLELERSSAPAVIATVNSVTLSMVLFAMSKIYF